MKYFTIFFLCLFQLSCIGQSSFKYKKVPTKYLPEAKVLQSFNIEAKRFIPKAYDLTKSLPSNYIKNGKVDYTSYLQKALDDYKIVIFPNFPILINVNGLQLRKNSILIFRSNSKLIMKPNDKEGYGLLNIFGVKNVIIYFPNLEGDRYSHLSDKGEWGMGIFIKGGSDVKIINPKISNCWGDGIYIGQGKTPSNNIQIYYAVLNANRRNGISIISVENLLLESPVISNTYGTKPGSGIDIEPNTNSDNIANIQINNPVTFNSQNYGILVYLESLRGTFKKNVDIKINNPIDEYSMSGFRMGKRKKGYMKQAKIKGFIRINNPTWQSEDNSYHTDDFTPRVIIKTNEKL